MRRGLLLKQLVLLAALAWRPVAQAADPPVNEVALVFAPAFESAREDLIVPISASGPALELGAGYRRALGRGAVHADLRLGLGVLFDRFDNLAGNLHHEIGVGYQHRLGAGLGGAVELGGVLRWISDGALFEAWDDAHLYWLTALTVGPSVGWRRALGARHHLEADADVALAALASRPPERRHNKQDALTHPSFFLSRLGSDPRLTSVLSTQWARLQLRLRRHAPDDLSRRGWGLGLDVRFAHAAWPERFAVLSTALTVSRGWSW